MSRACLSGYIEENDDEQIDNPGGNPARALLYRIFVEVSHHVLPALPYRPLGH